MVIDDDIVCSQWVHILPCFFCADVSKYACNLLVYTSFLSRSYLHADDCVAECEWILYSFLLLPMACYVWLCNTRFRPPEIVQRWVIDIFYLYKKKRGFYDYLIHKSQLPY